MSKVIFFAIVMLISAVCYTDTVYACGQCHGDKVAAVYDHAVVLQALKTKHVVEFTELGGSFRMSGEDNRIVVNEIKLIEGIDKDTIRISANPSAVSFAFAPKKGSVNEILVRISKKINIHKFTITHIQSIG